MRTPITIASMHRNEAVAAADMLCSIIAALPYYNDEAKHVEISLYTPELLRTMVSDDPNAVLVAQAEGVCVGLCISRYDDGPVWLSWYMTVPTWQGRGVGRALLHTLFETRRAEGINKIWCDCRTDNLGSRALLQQLGFQELCTLKQHWHGQDYVLFERFLV